VYISVFVSIRVWIYVHVCALICVFVYVHNDFIYIHINSKIDYLRKDK